MKKATALSGILVLLIFSLYAQDNKSGLIKNWQIEPTFNFRYFNITTFPEGENIDFLNYPESESGEPFYYAFLGFAARVEFNNNIKVALNAALYDHADPALIEFNAGYFPKNRWGITTGATMFSYLSNDFSSFHRKKYPDFDGNLHNNFQQRTRFLSAFYAGVEYFYPGGKTMLSVKLQAGFGGHHAFEEKLQQKQILSNYKEIIHYKTSYHFSPVFYPSIEFQQQLINAKSLTMGVSIRGSLFYTFTAIDYQQTIFQWTYENKSVKEIESENHPFIKADGSLGFFIRW